VTPVCSRRVFLIYHRRSIMLRSCASCVLLLVLRQGSVSTTPPPHTCTHTHTYPPPSHTHMHTLSHTYTRTRTHTHSRTHTRTHTHICTRTHAHAHTNTHTHTHTSLRPQHSLYTKVGYYNLAAYLNLGMKKWCRSSVCAKVSAHTRGNSLYSRKRCIRLAGWQHSQNRDKFLEKFSKMQFRL